MREILFCGVFCVVLEYWRAGSLAMSRREPLTVLDIVAKIH